MSGALGGGALTSMLGPMMGLSTGLGMAGSLFQGIMGFSAGMQQARAAKLAAAQASLQGGVAAQERLIQGNEAVGRAATLAAMSGGGLGGSTAGVLNQLAERTMFNARGAAYRGATEALNDEYMAKVDKDNAINSMISGGLGAASQGVSGTMQQQFRQSILSSTAAKTGEGSDYLALGVIG